MLRRLSILLAATLATGCATAKLAGPPPVVPPGDGRPRTVVLEPFFEAAEEKTSTVTQQAQVMNQPMNGFSNTLMGGPNTITIAQQVTQKPLFARVPMLAEQHRRLLVAVQALRPAWRVTSTSGVPVLEGPVTVVRTLIEGNETVESDRAFKNLSFFFGLVIWPLLFVAGQPVNEVERVFGRLERAEADAAALKTRLVRYPSQPDYAVNLSGIATVRRDFGLDVATVEGLLADERPRSGVQVEGFIQRLAAAVVALVEEKEEQTR